MIDESKFENLEKEELENVSGGCGGDDTEKPRYDAFCISCGKQIGGVWDYYNIAAAEEKKECFEKSGCPFCGAYEFEVREYQR